MSWEFAPGTEMWLLFSLWFVEIMDGDTTVGCCLEVKMTSLLKLLVYLKLARTTSIYMAFLPEKHCRQLGNNA